MAQKRLFIFVSALVSLCPASVNGQQQGFVARHNIPADRPIPSGYVRASQIARIDPSLPLAGQARPLGQLAQDVAPVGASGQAAAPKDPFQGASQAQPKQEFLPQAPQQGPDQGQIQALIDSQQKLPGKGPAGPLGPGEVDPQLLAQQQLVQPRVVYVPVPVAAAQPPATPAPAPANMPSWMTNPLSGNLPWNGR